VEVTIPTSPNNSAVPALDLEADEWWDWIFVKDLYHLDDPDGEIAMSVQVPLAFENAGYAIRQWAKADYHPVWVLRARRKFAPRFGTDAEFFQHALQVLEGADVRARKSELTAQRSGDRILVAFIWPLPSGGRRRRARRP
jgi:hypothetical protein